MSGPVDITVDEDGIHGTFHYRFGLSHLGTRHVTISTGRHRPVIVNRIPVAAHLEFVEHHDGTWQPNGRSSVWAGTQPRARHRRSARTCHVSRSPP
jgi:hypothetical protein